MSDQAIEQEIQAKGLNAPRITPGDIEANIGTEFYFTAGEGVLGASQMGTKPAGRSDSLNRLTFCVLVMKNGFTVTGESACASPENFDAELGKKIARTNAIAKVWPLMGYELRSRLHAQVVEADPEPTPTTERIESLLAGPNVVGVDLAKEQDRCVRVFLEKGAVVKVDGIPIWLDHDAVVRVHPANIPLMPSLPTVRPAVIIA